MNWTAFNIGFWQPFGPHGGESREQILERKEKEIISNGWTLWSFQFTHRLAQWFKEIDATSPKAVYVLCSDSRVATDPKGAVSNLKEYRPIDEVKWSPIPNPIKIPHPIGGKEFASAFKVKHIYAPHEIRSQPNFRVEWLHSTGVWRTDMIPTRNEYLIGRGEGTLLRKVYTVLELECPYIAILKK